MVASIGCQNGEYEHKLRRFWRCDVQYGRLMRYPVLERLTFLTLMCITMVLIYFLAGNSGFMIVAADEDNDKDTWHVL